jgi:hypothetical protein
VLEAAAEAYATALRAAGWEASLIGHAVREVERSAQASAAGAERSTEPAALLQGTDNADHDSAVVCTSGNSDGNRAPAARATTCTDSTSSNVSSAGAVTGATATDAAARVGDASSHDDSSSTSGSDSGSISGSNSSVSSANSAVPIEWNVYNTDLVRQMKQFELAYALRERGVVSTSA